MGLVLSIDVGTTNIKAALVDEQGRIVGAAKSLNMQLEGDVSGRAEHDPAKLRRALLEICRVAIGSRGTDIERIALTSYQFGLVLVDRAGNPITRISTFVDTTAQAHHAHFLDAVGDVDAMYSRTGCPPIFQYPSNRLHFLVAKDPTLPERIGLVLDSKAFLMHALTGEFVTDYSTANSLGCLDIAGRWDPAIIDVLGLRPAQFPRVLDGFVDSIPVTDAVCRVLSHTTATPEGDSHTWNLDSRPGSTSSPRTIVPSRRGSVCLRAATLPIVSVFWLRRVLGLGGSSSRMIR